MLEEPKLLIDILRQLLKICVEAETDKVEELKQLGASVVSVAFVTTAANIAGVASKLLRLSACSILFALWDPDDLMAFFIRFWNLVWFGMCIKRAEGRCHPCVTLYKFHCCQNNINRQLISCVNT